MPRQPGPDAAGVPQQAVQRGNDRQPCCHASEAYRRYLSGLREAAIRGARAVRANRLMTNHVDDQPRLAAGDAFNGGAVSRMMQGPGRQYVGSINAQHRHTGTPWEARYKSCLADTERCLPTCCR